MTPTNGPQRRPLQPFARRWPAEPMDPRTPPISDPLQALSEPFDLEALSEPLDLAGLSEPFDWDGLDIGATAAQEMEGFDCGADVARLMGSQP